VCALALAVTAGAGAQTPTTATIRPFLWRPGMAASDIGEVNVFRRFSSDRTDAMREFYSEVLALPVLPSTALGGGQMIRYPIGASEVKLFPVAPSAANTTAIGEARLKPERIQARLREIVSRFFGEHEAQQRPSPLRTEVNPDAARPDDIKSDVAPPDPPPRLRSPA
jgi:hypothetical protein